MAFGVLILVLPELVKLLFAALFMALGFVLMGFAWRLKSGGMPGGMPPMPGGPAGPGAGAMPGGMPPGFPGLGGGGPALPPGLSGLGKKK